MKNINYLSEKREEVLSEVVQALSENKLVIFPSDTVYGVLVDATSEEAVKKLIAFKNRPAGKPISVFVADMEMLSQHVKLGEKKAMLEQILPGPFTVILPSQHKVNALLESERGTLGVRIPAYSLDTDLVKQFGKPITATSANLAGRPPHYSIESLLNDVSKEKQKLIDVIVDAGVLPHNKPSTVIDLTEQEVKVIREGDVSFIDKKIYTSSSPEETAKVAQDLIKEIIDKSENKSVSLILQGELGSGKTVFVKGIAEALSLKEDIISPTYVVYFEYHLTSQPFKNLYHFDLYNIDKAEEFKHLGIEKMFDEKNLLCFEWGDKSGEILPLLKERSYIVYITLEYVSETERRIIVRSS